MRLFCTDLDGTLLGNPSALACFSERWAAVDPARRPLLVYNTNRTVADTITLVEARQLPEPDSILGSLGTELHGGPAGGAIALRERFRPGWDLTAIEEIVGALPGLRRQPLPPHHFKSSWLWSRARRDEIEALERRLHAAGLRAKLIYSARYFLDIVPQQAGKGAALAWLCQQLRMPLSQVLVAGDSGHDAGMFLLPDVRGILVENALPELQSVALHSRTFMARQPMAEGILQGLEHFGVLPLAASPLPAVTAFR